MKCNNVIPAQAGIQNVIVSLGTVFLGTDLRRCDESFFNSVLAMTLEC